MSGIYGGERLALMEVDTPAGAGGNGHGAPPPKPMPVRTKTVYLDGDYEGYAATIRTNAPFGIFLAISNLQSGDDGLAGVRAFGELLRLMPQLVLAWNVCDEEGNAIPCDEAGMKRVPADLLMALVSNMGGGDDIPK